MSEIIWREVKELRVGTDERWIAEIGGFKVELEKAIFDHWDVSISYTSFPGFPPEIHLSITFQWDEEESPFQKALLLAGRLANKRIRVLSEFCDAVIESEERGL